MRRVTGIGGIFFKAQDPGALRAWYREHLGIDVQATRSNSGNHRRVNKPARRCSLQIEAETRGP
jgi:hypothetical protein